MYKNNSDDTARMAAAIGIETGAPIAPDNMDNNTRRRERLALTLETIAAAIRNANTADSFDMALGELFDLGRDVNGYHARTLDGMYAAENAAADN